MLIDLCMQLNRNAQNNGSLSAAPMVMEMRGWRSTASRQAAINELIEARLLCITRQGDRKRCSLYAVTLWPLDYDPMTMTSGPGSYATRDWSLASVDSNDELSTYTMKQKPKPAVWNSLRKDEPRKPRKNAISHPAAGQPPSDMTPLRDNPGTSDESFNPAAGAKAGKSAIEVVPQRETFSDLPSAGVRLGVVPPVLKAVSGGRPSRKKATA